MAPQADSEADHNSDPNSRVMADAEGWALLDGLRRRLDDQGAHSRKTATQVTQLAGSIAALVETQRRRSKTLNLNSFVAYLIFTMLCGGAFYFLYQNRAKELVDARDRAATDRDAAIKRADQVAATLAARQAADAAAWDTWQLLEAGKRGEAAKRIAELANAKLSRFDRDVLSARVAQLEATQMTAALKTANAAYRSGRYSDAMAALDPALDGAALPNAESHYVYGLAALRAEQFDNAVTHLRAALSAGIADEEARLRLASALERNGQKADARSEYDRFAAEHPESPSAGIARSRSVVLATGKKPDSSGN